MSVKSSKAKLGRATKDLAAHWEEVTRSWRDTKAREFEARFIAPLPDHVRSALTIIDELDAVLTRLRRDCE